MWRRGSSGRRARGAVPTASPPLGDGILSPIDRRARVNSAIRSPTGRRKVRTIGRRRRLPLASD